MRAYVEPIVFILNFNNIPEGDLPRQIFEKAKEKKLELFTSIWTIPQFVGEINELYVKRTISKEIRRDFIFNFRELEKELGDSLTKVYPVKEVMLTCISYILELDVDYIRAWHLATAKLSQCKMYIGINDSYGNLNKNLFKKEFEIFDLSDKNDVEELNRRIRNL